MKIYNYFFSDIKQNPVLVNSQKDGLCLCGETYGRPGIKDGQTVRTSYLKSWNEHQVETYSGSVYELGTMNSDYVEMLEAIKLGTPVIIDWDLRKDVLMDTVPTLDTPIEEALRVKQHEGFVLSGKDLNGNSICGEVIQQSQNYVTLLLYEYDEPGFRAKEVKCFVCWKRFSWEAEAKIQISGGIAGMRYTSFEEAFFMKCRPVIPV